MPKISARNWNYKIKTSQIKGSLQLIWKFAEEDLLDIELGQ